MATITEKNVAETIHTLMAAGKKPPLDEQRVNATDKVKACENILQTTVGLWWKLFGPRKISVERWEDATAKACTITSAGSLNVNMLTPALMETALKTVEVEHVMLNQSRHEAYKQNKELIHTDADHWKEHILLRWTYRKLAERRPIMPYQPTADEVWAKGRALGMSENEIAEQSKLIKIYLNDCNYAKANGMRMTAELFLRPDRKLFFRKVN